MGGKRGELLEQIEACTDFDEVLRLDGVAHQLPWARAIWESKLKRDKMSAVTPGSPRRDADALLSPRHDADALLRSASQLRVKADKSSGPIYHLVRWPIVIGLVLVISVQALLYLMVRLAVFGWELKHWARYRALADARTYEEWKLAAVAMDQSQGASCSSAWTEEESILLSQTQAIRQLITGKQLGRLVKELRLACSIQRSRGAAYEVFFTRSHTGINQTFRAYADTVVHGLRLVSGSEHATGRLYEELSQSYGQSALLLSGGAGNGFYHLGCIKALLDQGLLPKVISGSSAGALMAAFACTRDEKELARALRDPEALCKLFSSNEEPLSVKLGRLWRRGVLFDQDQWTEKLLVLTGGAITFQEAHELTGRTLCISVFDGANRAILLSHATTPNVLIHSAVLASAAVPRVLEPQCLYVKAPDGSIKIDQDYGSLWRDGSIKVPEYAFLNLK